MQDARGKFSIFRSGVILGFVMALILGFAAHPDVMAKEKDQFSFFPVVFNPSAPGTTGTIVYTVDSGTEREIYTKIVSSGVRARLTDNSAVDDMPSWAPDGSLIAFTSDRRKAGYFEIYTMDYDGSNPVQLTDSSGASAPRDDNSPSFSPEGDRIVFASDRNGPFQIFVMNSDGSGQTAITETDYQSGDPEWSADGTKIVFSSTASGALEIFTMNPDGSNMKRVTTGGPDFRPSWSPDGKQIVFTSLRDGERNIYVMNADGSDQKRLTDFYSDWADWSPDGARIVFTKREATGTQASGGPKDEGDLDAQALFAHSDNQEEVDSNLYTMKPDGSDRQIFAESPIMREDRGNWGP